IRLPGDDVRHIKQKIQAIFYRAFIFEGLKFWTVWVLTLCRPAIRVPRDNSVLRDSRHRGLTFHWLKKLIVAKDAFLPDAEISGAKCSFHLRSNAAGNMSAAKLGQQLEISGRHFR